MRFATLFVVIIPILVAMLSPVRVTEAANCQFVLGFKTLHDLIPQIIGDCLEDEHHSATTGDGLQTTTGTNGAGGLLVWRKADNWTAFTDGYRTWVNGPCGILMRLNTQRFRWEADAASFQLVPDGCPASLPSRTGGNVRLLIPILSSEVANYFDQIAGPNDIAAISASHLDLVGSVNQGQRLVAFTSWSQAEATLPSLAGSIGIIGYDPEHWSQTPPDEQANLPDTVAHASQTAQGRGLALLVVPDRAYTTQFAAQLAPHVDYFILQGQRLEAQPDVYAAWVGQMTAEIRQSSPHTKIFAQVATGQGSPDQMYAAFRAVSSQVDGVAVWASPSQLVELQQFVTLLRQGG